MKWLVDNLKEAEEKNEKVVILGHIRPGSESRWQDYKLNHFEKVVQKYHDRIIGQFYGHQHQDSFSFMMSEDNKIINTMFVGGIVVTKFNKHSTVRLYKYDAVSFKLLDYEDFYIPLKESEQNGAIIWKRLYKFTEEYGVPDLSNESFEKVFKSFQTNDVHWSKYNLNFKSRYSNRNCNQSCKKKDLCKMISPTHERYAICQKNMKL